MSIAVNGSVLLLFKILYEGLISEFIFVSAFVLLL